MKYELDTMPVWDALKAGSECPFCLLETRSRTAAVRYYLGASVMAPEVRVTVNERGFSRRHWRILAKDANRLGLGLLAHTRLKRLREQLHPLTHALDKESARAAEKGGLDNLLAGKKSLVAAAEALCQRLEALDQSCLIQERVETDLARYFFTTVHLVRQDQDFRQAWEASKGVCLRHLPGLIRLACQELGPKDLGRFLLVLVGLQDANLERLENDIWSFTKQFDATASHQTTGDPKEAIERTLQKLTGVFPEYVEESRTRKGPLMGGVSG